MVLFCILPLAGLIPLAYVVDEGLRRSRNFDYAEWNDLFAGRIQADLLFMGASRAWVHFSPQITDSALGVNSYNLGMDATLLDLEYERLKIYLRYNKMPKYIVQEVSFNTVLLSSKDLPHYQQFLPYLRDSAIWRIYRSKYSGVSLSDRYFPLYKYNNQLPLIKEGIQSYLGKGSAPVKYKGYQGNPEQWNNTFAGFVQDHPDGLTLSIDPGAVQLFRDYVAFCKKSGIKLILVYSPCYYKATNLVNNMDSVMSILHSVSTEYNVPLLDYRYNYIDSSTAFFYNGQHMNKEGAEQFSRMLAKDLVPYIKDTAAHL